jgi:hypothetical protein
MPSKKWKKVRKGDNLELGSRGPYGIGPAPLVVGIDAVPENPCSRVLSLDKDQGRRHGQEYPGLLRHTRYAWPIG